MTPRWRGSGKGVPPFWARGSAVGAASVYNLPLPPKALRAGHVRRRPDLRAYARQPARGVEVGGWRARPFEGFCKICWKECAVPKLLLVEDNAHTHMYKYI